MSRNTEEIRLTIPSQLEALSRVEQFSSDIANKLKLNDDQKDNLAIAVTEVVGNAIVHGNNHDPQKNVSICFKIKPKWVEVSVTDQGPGFKPSQLDNPLDPENVMKESGRGIFILKSIMDDVQFSFSPRGTTVTFKMKR